jgi:hypothetical protein
MNFFTLIAFVGSPRTRVIGGSQTWPVLVHVIPNTPVLTVNFSAWTTLALASARRTAAPRRSRGFVIATTYRETSGCHK